MLLNICLVIATTRRFSVQCCLQKTLAEGEGSQVKIESFSLCLFLSSSSLTQTKGTAESGLGFSMSGIPLT